MGISNKGDQRRRVEPLDIRLSQGSKWEMFLSSRFLLIDYPWLHIFFARIHVACVSKLPTEAYDQPTSAYDGHVARGCQQRVRRACMSVRVFPASGPLRAFRKSDGRTEAQLYGQECLIDVTTFEVGGSSVRHFFMSFINAPSLLLFESRFDCWLLVTPLPFPGYIFSRWFKDSLRNFCNGKP